MLSLIVKCWKQGWLRCRAKQMQMLRLRLRLRLKLKLRTRMKKLTNSLRLMALA